MLHPKPITFKNNPMTTKNKPKGAFARGRIGNPNLLKNPYKPSARNTYPIIGKSKQKLILIYL